MKDILDAIKTTNFSDLSSIEATILKCGLNNEFLNEQPPEFEEYYGKGLHMWQYPNQLAKFAKFISSFNVKSYMEIGCRFGGTFIFISEILKRNNPDIELYALDCIAPSNILKSYSEISNFLYFHCSSWDPRFIQAARKIAPEMVFIDGDHSWEGVSMDYNTFKDIKNTKYFVFHDVANFGCPGVVKMWNLMKENQDFECHEFTDQYKSVAGGPFLGIGLAIRK
jgi:cephalosporin hydroxylase